MKRIRLQVYACCFAVLCSASGFAVYAQGETVAPPEEKAAEEKPRGTYEEEITVTESPSLTVPSAAARKLALREIPGGVELVDVEEIKRGRASTLKDALEQVPGVIVQPRFGSEEARLSIRGSGLQRTFHGRGLKLLQDSVPLNLADGGFDFQAVDPLAARYIEVLRGANGLGQGAATLGGAINYVSPTGHDGSPVQARLEGGAFGYLRGQVGSSFVRGAFDSFATLTHFAQDGFRDHARQSTQRFFGNLGYRTGADRETRFWVTAVSTDSELPGSLTKAQLEADARQAAPNNLRLDQKRDFNLFRLASRTTFRLADGRVDLGAFWATKHLDHPIFQVIDQFSHDFGVDARWQNAPGKRHQLSVGFAPSYGVLDDERFVNVLGARGARTGRGETESLNLELWSEDRIEVSPRLALVVGAQLSHAVRDFSDRFLTDGDQTDSQSFTGVSPKLGFFFEVGTGAFFFGNVSRSFEPPSFGELVNVGGNGLTQLEAQTATSFELGTRGGQRKVSWDVVAYHARVDDELLSLTDAIGNPLGTVNADRTTHAGLEAGLSLLFPAAGGDLRLRQTYTWSRFRFDGDPVYGDNQLAGLPEHYYRAELLYERQSGLYGGPNLEWVPDRYPVDHANTLFAEGYTVFGAKLGYRAKDGWAAFVEGKNLTDENYAATTGVIADARGLDAAQFLPGDGASFFAGLEYRW